MGLIVGVAIVLIIAFSKEKENREEVQLLEPPNSHIEGCYCSCHSWASSRPSCLHCHPESFINRRDPYCETEEMFQKRKLLHDSVN